MFFSTFLRLQNFGITKTHTHTNILFLNNVFLTSTSTLAVEAESLLCFDNSPQHACAPRFCLSPTTLGPVAPQTQRTQLQKCLKKAPAHPSPLQPFPWQQHHCMATGFSGSWQSDSCVWKHFPHPQKSRPLSLKKKAEDTRISVTFIHTHLLKQISSLQCHSQKLDNKWKLHLVQAEVMNLFVMLQKLAVRIYTEANVNLIPGSMHDRF